ncbi:MAG: tetratricopeptide (TPR) repeat protein [Psychroserpens sp.]|jgi:tetratricopeptide (TPR) repeat protein
MDYSKLNPGDENYRAYIGPPLQYDFMGATQFRLLCSLGLRADHNVLDLGCGSLRAGRFLISYLEPHRYHGIEPNQWLINDAIKEQVGQDMVDIKQPKFDNNSTFNTSIFDIKFDYIIAQSIFSHTGIDLLSEALANIQSSLNQGGYALVTFIKGEEDFDGSGWVYPGCVSFTTRTIKKLVLKADLFCKELPWYHPRQTWFILSNNEVNLPKEEELTYLSGAVLSSQEFKNSVKTYEPKKLCEVSQSTKSLVLTGFHRSATSATANYLLDAGLDMGSNLMLGNISNVKGHFEDWDAVLLHDEQLSRSDTDWQFQGDCELTSAPRFLNSYIKQRSDNNLHWGVKDPRACLFLEEWKSSLGDSGHFLFVVRHWSSCIESLLYRHSRDLAFAIPTLTAKSTGFKFWLDPVLAAKMWLSYNKRLLTFAKKHPDITIVITQRSLFGAVPLIDTINKKFGLNLDTKVTSPFDSNLIRDKASERVFSSLSIALTSQLNQVWDELLELTTFKSSNEEPIIDSSQLVSQSDICDVFSKVQQVENITTDALAITAYDNWFNHLSSVTDGKKIQDYLDKTSAVDITNIADDSWLEIIDKQFFLNGAVQLSAAKLLQRMECYQPAIEYFQRAILLGNYFPYIDMQLAQCWQALNVFDKAEFFFNKAIKANPNNPVFYTHYATLLLMLNNEEKAEQYFLLGYQKGDKQGVCVLAYCEFLESKDRSSEAVGIARLFVDTKESPAAQRLINRLLLKTDINAGKDSYDHAVQGKLRDKNLQEWLATSVQLLDNPLAETDFIIRCLEHWKAFNE